MGDDAGEFLDAGGAIVGKVNDCASKSVRDASRGNAFGWVSVSIEPIWTRVVIGLGVGLGNALGAMNRGSECGAG